MNELIETENVKIENMIYEVRGQQVMLDSDLARLYECANGTKTINLAVKRHINRFPERFMFQLTEEECKNFSRFQIETLKGRGHNIKYLPFVFTEQGVAMLATVLRTNVAEEISIKIMDAFVAMRKYISKNLIENKYINDMLIKHDKEISENTESIKLIQNTLEKFEEKKKINEIYFNGQIYDAYSKILEIFNDAKDNLIIIDGYADKTILDIVKRLKVKVKLITKPNNLLTKQDIEKYNKQYNNLEVIFDNTYHDRYFILDDNILYHCGASINRIGYQTFSITQVNDRYILNALLHNIH